MQFGQPLSVSSRTRIIEIIIEFWATGVIRECTAKMLKSVWMGIGYANIQQWINSAGLDAPLITHMFIMS